jgi:GDP/UDP-N,N'-diacetylbacillosamine 2-epimerase (hydrolysing)
VTRAARRRRRVAVVTGTRAEYGVLQTVLAAIAAHPRLELQLAVTGMHLLAKFGRTVRQVERDGWPIVARVPMQRGDGAALDHASGLARGVQGLAKAFDEAGSEIVLVLGDRIEALAGALAATTTGRILAHVHGGDVAPGDLDDRLRHSITKLAHLHLVASRSAGRRVARLGESRQRIVVVGAPGLDRLRELLDEAPPRRGPSGTALVVQHPIGRSDAVERRGMTRLLNEVAAAGLHRTLVYPNSDRGHDGIITALESHARRSPAGQVRVVRSLQRDEYLRLLLAADVLVGNSSSGIIEAPLAGTPTVDVGERQAGRELGGPTVVHATEDAASIRRALARALRLPHRCRRRSVYGDGHAGERIAAALVAVSPDRAFERKTITY